MSRAGTPRGGGRRGWGSETKIDRVSDIRGGFGRVPGSVITSEIDDRALRLYAFLAWRCDYETGVCKIKRGRPEIAEGLHWSLAKVDRAMSTLLKAGLVERRERYDRAGDRAPNEYAIPALAREGTRKSEDTPAQDRGGGERKTASDVGAGSRRQVLKPERQTSDPLSHRVRDELFEAVAAVCDVSVKHMTRSARGAMNRAIGEIGAVGGTAIEVSRAAEAYHRAYSTPLTPAALAKHWPSLLNGGPSHRRPDPARDLLASTLGPQREGRRT